MHLLHAAAAAGMLLCLASVARADPADDVLSPRVEEGEREVELGLGTQSKRNEPRSSAATVGVGYGATSWWAVELELKYEREAASTRFDAIELENRFQLIETGRHPFDLGILLEVERPRDRTEGWEFTWGPLLQVDAGRMQYMANVLWQRQVRSDSPAATELGYRMQAKYRWREQLEFGVQALGDVGPWRHWRSAQDQSHRVGPALFGRTRIAPGHSVKWNAALLLGATRSSADRVLRAAIEYEF